MYPYRVFRPGAGVVSWHRTLTGAERSLARQVAGAVRQGGYSHDRIEYFDGQDWIDLAELRGVSE